MKRMRCEIVVSQAERRSQKDIAGKIAVGLVSRDTLGAEVATWYLLSHGIALATIVRVMTTARRRRY